MILVAARGVRDLGSPYLVDAAINNAKNAKFTVDGGTVLVLNTASDSLVDDRAQALRNDLA